MAGRRLVLLVSMFAASMAVVVVAAPAPKPDERRLPREVQEARAALERLRRGAADPKVKPDEVWKEYLALRLRFSGTTECVQAAELMNKVPSPLDKLDRNAIPPEDRPPWLPKEVVAVLGEHRGRHWEEVRQVAVSPDGKLVASMGAVVRLWDPRTMYQYAALEMTPPARPWGLAFVPKQRKLVVGYRGRLVVCDVSGAKPKVERIITGLAGDLADIVVSPDGKRVACVSPAGIEIWDLASKKSRRQALLQRDPLGGGSLAFSPDGTFFADAGDKGSVGRLRRLADGKFKEPTTLPGTRGPLVFSPDGKTLLTGVQRASHVRLWDVTSREPKVKATFGGRLVRIDQAAFSPDGQLLATGSYEHKLRLWPLHEAQRKKLGLDKDARYAEYAIPTRIQSLAWFPDGKTLALGGKDGVVRLWDVAAGEEHFPTRGHHGPVYAVAFSPDCRALASGGDDKTIRLWDVAQARPRERAVLGHSGLVTSVGFAPQGRYLASTTAFDAEIKKNIRLWDLAGASPSLCAVFQSHTAHVDYLAFSSRGSFLLTVGRDYPERKPGERVDYSCQVGVMRLWDFQHGKVRLRDVIRPVYHPGEKKTLWDNVNLGAIALNEKWMALGFGSSWRLWDIAGKKCREVAMIARNDLFSGVTFSPDGKGLVCSIQTSFKDDKEKTYCLKCWELVDTTLKYRWSLDLQGEMPFDLTFLPDGKSLLARTSERRLLIWSGPRFRHQVNLALPSPRLSMTVANDGRHVALANSNGTIYILRLRNLLGKP